MNLDDQKLPAAFRSSRVGAFVITLLFLLLSLVTGFGTEQMFGEFEPQQLWTFLLVIAVTAICFYGLVKFGYKLVVPDRLGVSADGVVFKTFRRTMSWNWDAIDNCSLYTPPRSVSPFLRLNFNGTKSGENGAKSSYLLATYWRVDASEIAALINRSKPVLHED